jgi:Low affinity iron permease
LDEDVLLCKYGSEHCKNGRVKLCFYRDVRYNLLWTVTGPWFHWSDTPKLVINSVAHIVSMRAWGGRIDYDGPEHHLEF